MKKILLICVLFALPAWADELEAAQTRCLNLQGEPIVGRDNATVYCESKTTMNWWSAFAWCHSLGGNSKLIDITEECNKVSGTVHCPNLENVGTGQVWTQNLRNPHYAYRVYLAEGNFNVVPGAANDIAYNGICTALCVGF